MLHNDVQRYLSENWRKDLPSLLLNLPHFEGASPREIAEQLEGRKKSHQKLPSWFKTPGIYYPPRRNLEQTSSETTAAYKASLVDGGSLLDLTGGFGVDSLFFSRHVEKVVYCEMNTDLAEIAAHNFRALGANTIEVHAMDGMEFLRQGSRRFHWLYADPSRREDDGRRVFQLSDCAPDIPRYLDLLFKSAPNILVKTAPLLDLTQGIRELNHVREIHVVAVDNEVKELLWVLRRGFTEEIEVKTRNIGKEGIQIFDFDFDGERRMESLFSEPVDYLYEPNAAILKSGAFKAIGKRYGLFKLHEHTHLYTGKELIDFPGRRFEILRTLPYSLKNLRRLGSGRATISIRNFQGSVADIRRKSKIKEGGDLQLFLCRNRSGKSLILQCRKIGNRPSAIY